MIDRLVRLYEELIGDRAAADRWRGDSTDGRAAASQVSVTALMRSVTSGGVAARGDAAALKSAITAEEAQLAATPADDVIAVRTGRLRLGQLYRQAERFAEAHEQLGMVLAEEPSN